MWLSLSSVYYAFAHYEYLLIKSQTYENFDNWECTSPSQSKKKNVILSFTETKFHKDENGNRPLDKDVGRITLKYCIPLILNLKM